MQILQNNYIKIDIIIIYIANNTTGFHCFLSVSVSLWTVEPQELFKMHLRHMWQIAIVPSLQGLCIN